MRRGREGRRKSLTESFHRNNTRRDLLLAYTFYIFLRIYQLYTVIVIFFSGYPSQLGGKIFDGIALQVSKKEGGRRIDGK